MTSSSLVEQSLCFVRIEDDIIINSTGAELMSIVPRYQSLHIQYLIDSYHHHNNLRFPRICLEDHHHYHQRHVNAIII